jgi:uncharacterized protein (UPF0332 family)
MDGSVKDLSYYRIKQAGEMLEAAFANYNIGQYKTSLNRSYYAVFHSMRAVNLLDGFDSSKHSGVIAHFNQYYIKTGLLDKSLSDIIKSTYYLREKSDYDDFFVASKSDAKSQLHNAEIFVKEVRAYLDYLDT